MFNLKKVISIALVFCLFFQANVVHAGPFGLFNLELFPRIKQNRQERIAYRYSVRKARQYNRYNYSVKNYRSSGSYGSYSGYAVVNRSSVQSYGSNGGFNQSYGSNGGFNEVNKEAEKNAVYGSPIVKEDSEKTQKEVIYIVPKPIIDRPVIKRPVIKSRCVGPYCNLTASPIVDSKDVAFAKAPETEQGKETIFIASNLVASPIVAKSDLTKTPIILASLE